MRTLREYLSDKADVDRSNTLSISDLIKIILVVYLVGDMPVVMNMNISKESDPKGSVLWCPRGDKAGIIVGNHIHSEKQHNTLSPVRDVDVNGYPRHER